MPDNHIAPPAGAEILLAQRLPESEDHVIALQIERGNFIGCADSTVMRIVKEQEKSAALPAGPADPRDELRIRPFMYDDGIGLSQCRFMIVSIIVSFRA